MSYKRIIPCIFLLQGKAVRWFDDRELLSEDAIALAKHYSDQGADELLVFDLSDSDEDHEESIQKSLQMSHPHRHHFCKIHNLLINNGNHSDNKDSKNKRNSNIYEHDGKLLRNMLLQAVNQRLQQKGNDNPHQDRQTAFININNPIIQLQLLQQ